MARRNIFDIAKENLSLESELERIDTLIADIGLIKRNSDNCRDLFEFVNLYCFGKWKNRGHFLDLDDFLYTIGYSEAAAYASDNEESLFIYLETIYNIWHLAYWEKLSDVTSVDLSSDFFLLKNIMDSILDHYNYIAYIDEENEKVLLIENKPETTAVAEIITPELSLPVIRYNHHALKGDIESKKSILRTLGDHLEPQRKDLETLDKQLSQDIFYMLNNMNIRHNNVTLGDKNYKQNIAEMNNEDLEIWYDELYQMILLAYLVLDNRQRSNRIKDLKAAINGG